MTEHRAPDADLDVRPPSRTDPGEASDQALEAVAGEDEERHAAAEERPAVPEAGVAVASQARIDATPAADDDGDRDRAGEVAGSPDRGRTPGNDVPEKFSRLLPVQVASFHLVRHADALGPLLRVPRLRGELRRARGLRFWRLLGTGRGESMSFGADPRRWALFAVWDSEAALLAFVGGSAAGRLFGRGAVERWDGRLQLAGARGSWDGVRLVGSPSAPTAGPAGAPLAVLTRATIRAVRLPAFYAAVGATDAALRRAPGRLRSVGAGEWPLKRQATFSLWRDPAAARGFAYAGAEHVEVIRRVRAQGWYSEELFARFAVETVTGTWDGADPLAI